MQNRRDFIKNVSLAGTGLLLTPATKLMPEMSFPALCNLYDKIDKPVTIESIRLIKAVNELFVEVTGSNGLKGITMANTRMPNLVSIFQSLIVPYFKGKDARDIGSLVDGVFKDGRLYKFAGMPFANCVGHVEIAILDLLGKSASLSVYSFFGKKQRDKVDIYLSGLTRETTPEEEADILLKALAASGAQAVKIKVGGRMKYDEVSKIRTEKLVPYIRKKLGDHITIYADGNGSFDVKSGIEVGKLLTDFGIKIFEEPCPWEDVESNQQVAKALKIIVAGGEQDSSLPRWKFISKNNVYKLLQPDLYYNGGMIRTIQVAEMAAEFNKNIAPHSPKADPLTAAMLQAVSVVPNMYGYQEYPLDAVGKRFPGWYVPHFKVEQGKIMVPPGTGLGISYDETIFKQAVEISG